MSDTIDRMTAIERMARGEKCETFWPRDEAQSVWLKTRWADFDNQSVAFRIPPEPRRVAQEFWLVGTSDLPIKVWAHEPSMIQPNEVWRKRVREVLPDEVCVRRMTRDQANVLYEKAPCHGGQNEGFFACLYALGLIREEGT